MYSLDKPERVLVEAGPIVGEQNRVARVRGVVFYAGRLAGRHAGQMQALLEAGDVLGRLVRYAGDRVGVIQKAERQPGGDPAFRRRGCGFGSGRGRRLARVLHDLQDLSFDDAADAIQIGAALAFDCVVIQWFAA